MPGACVARNMCTDDAVSRCPFLHNMSANSGNDYASNLATSPPTAIDALGRCDRGSLEATFALFHGSQGVMPLPRHVHGISSSGSGTDSPRVPAAVAPRPNRLRSAPLASLSMGLPNFLGDFFHSLARQQQQPKARPARPQPSHTSSSSTASGQCPLRKVLGPVAGWVFSKAGNLQCPTIIVQARAALAATPPVKTLRPQALPIKLLAVAAVAAAANIPCGMWREHTEKFSLQWVMAVHASIPFIAMLRKAVILPKLAIAMTFAAAVAGQAIGARLERERMARDRAATEAAPAAAGSSPQSGLSSSLTVRRSKAASKASCKARTLPHKAPATVLLSPDADSAAAVPFWMSDNLEWALEGSGKGCLRQQLPQPKNAAHLVR